MLPYFFVLIFIFSWMILEKKSLNRKSFFIPFFVLVLFGTIRSYLVGTDSEIYTHNFRYGLDVDYFSFNENLEYGYQLLNFIILKFTDQYYILFLISSIIVVGSYLIFFKKYSNNYLTSVFVFFTFGFYTFYFNGLRQGIAMSIAIWSLNYITKKNIIKFSIIVFLASLFHKSALFMFLFYFLIKFDTKLEYKFLIVLFLSIFFSKIGIDFLASNNDRYENYANASENSGGYITIIFYFLIGIIIYLYNKKTSIYQSIEYVLFELYILGLAFILPVAMLGSNPSGPQRLIFYSAWGLCLLIPTLLYKLNDKIYYLLFYFLALLYFNMRTSSFSNLSPYQINDIFRIF